MFIDTKVLDRYGDDYRKPTWVYFVFLLVFLIYSVWFIFHSPTLTRS